MKLSFKKRIAVINTVVVAIITAIVYVAIYTVVYFSSFRHLDSDILLEKDEIINTLDWKGDSIIINKMPEWEESEHRKVEVNPTFIQIVDNKDRMIFKSVNMQTNHFLFSPSNEKEIFYNTQIDKQKIRIGQFPIKNEEGKVIGQLTIGISQQESYYVLHNLLLTLFVSYPVLLLVLYIVIYLAASKAIAPVHRLIKEASLINDSNINTRLPLPENEDELFQLAKTINELLSRIEKSIQQQKQFTSDASHEIRTPLAAIRGTLEILIRKKREPQQYEEKIRDVMGQTDRLNQLLDQLLQLARLESGVVITEKESVDLHEVVTLVAKKHEKNAFSKNIRIHLDTVDAFQIMTDPLYLDMIIDNLLSNAIKYGNNNGNVFLAWDDINKILSIKDDGPGIDTGQIPFLFDRFYRVDDSRSSTVPGSGLGLAIVKKLSDLLHIKISVNSSPGNTVFSLQFSK